MATDNPGESHEYPAGAKAGTGDIALAPLPENIRMETSRNYHESAKLVADWEGLDPIARRYTLHHIGRTMMAEYGGEPTQLLDKPLPPNIRGRFDPETGHIEINEDLLKNDDPREALRTYLHEYRHSFQDAEITASRGSLAHTVDAARVQELEKPYEEPTRPGDTSEEAQARFERYRSHPQEVDARAFAEQATDKILKMRDEYRGLRQLEVSARSDSDRVVTQRLGQDIRNRV